MWSKKNVEELNLTPEQMAIFTDYQNREQALRRSLTKCKVNKTATEKIITKSDLKRVDLEHTDALEEEIKNMWKDFIYD